ncbi:MAG: fibronectin type III domain-containing protein [Eubacterium sp.]|nr:fibronectin type III domain-containing protein [Eubacterium sp.]MBR1531922.1 fibronectin type III domain-containing protein [Eubacterium sp.]
MKRIIKVLICCILAVSMLTPMSALAASRLATPTGFKVVTTTTSSVRVKWNKVKGAGKYTIQYSTNKKFKKAKKITVKGPAATVKKLAAKKVYYFRIRAIKKGKKSSKYTKAISAKTVNRLNVDKKLKGKWTGYYSTLLSGDGYEKYSFNGKGKVTVDNFHKGKKTVRYKKLSGNRVTFTVFSVKYIVKCYSDSDLLSVTKPNSTSSVKDVFIRDSGFDWQNRSFDKEFVNTSWYSPYFGKYCEREGYKLDKITFSESYSYGSYKTYMVMYSPNRRGYLNEERVDVCKKNLAIIFDTSYINGDVVLEKRSANKINAFILPYYEKGIVKEVWTKK